MSKATKADIAKEIEEFLSSHNRRGEAYDFDIKLQKIYVPDSVRRRLGEEEINRVADDLAQSDLEAFMDQLKKDFPWIHEWRQEGRSGGWLTIVPDHAVMDDYGNVDDLRDAKKRLKDLYEIERQVEEAKDQHVADLESKKWWDEVAP